MPFATYEDWEEKNSLRKVDIRGYNSIVNSREIEIGQGQERQKER